MRRQRPPDGGMGLQLGFLGHHGLAVYAGDVDVGSEGDASSSKAQRNPGRVCNMNEHRFGWRFEGKIDDQALVEIFCAMDP